MTDEFRKIDAELAARGATRMVFDISRIEALLDLLGTPQRAYPAIHLTGTNGKTSTARMIEALLRTHGLRTGLYTSPHMDSVRERITVDGEPVSEERFVEIYDEVAPVAAFLDERGHSAESLTYFDMTTAMAFAAFADAPVDVAVVEVGLGGAEDSTNVLHAGTCVITPIGIDHTEWLGDTVEEIATAKAGIIHSGATLVLADQPPEAVNPILRRCAEVGAGFVREGSEFGVLARDLAVGGQVLTLQGLGGVYSDVFVPLHGAHQAQNAAVALAAAEAFLGARQLDAEVVRDAFAAVASPGRLERVRTAPTILLDAAHNPHGVAAMVRALGEDFAFSRLIAVVAVLADKDVAGMLGLLEPAVDAVVCTRNSSPRGLPADELARIALDFFDEGRVALVPSLPDAIEAAVTLAEVDVEGELGAVGVLITGSVVTVADARRLLHS
jgi:dihydrofolate synthase/folylpolyglutamate synthase